MRYSITFIEKDYQTLVKHLFSYSSFEQAAYLQCRQVKTDSEIRLLIRKVIPVRIEDIEEQSAVHMKIRPRSFLRVMKAADQEKECFIFVHSHPTGLRHFSSRDDAEEEKLFRTAYVRIATEGLHASIIFVDSQNSVGRIWFANGTTKSIDLIRVIGNTFRFYFRSLPENINLQLFDRQVQAFGEHLQLLLGNLRIGIIGVGGTGSAVAEQLIRLGVGNLLLVDNQDFESTNVNRVYGSRIIDESIPKVKLIERLAADIGLGTVIKIVKKRIIHESAFSQLRDCDIIFGCTDDEWGRSILTKLAIYYFIPVFDMGVQIDSEHNVIRSIQGRVTTLMPSASCLFCRGRIKHENIRAESINYTSPEKAEQLRDEGYIRGLSNQAPAVIPLTTAIASSAVLEFLHRLTGCLGSDRESTEVLHRFDSTEIRTNKRGSLDKCFCNDASNWGKGDVTPLLDVIWPQE